jgi:hypothetical protein
MLLAFAAAAIVVRAAQAVLRRVIDAIDIVGVDNRAAISARAKALVNGLVVLAYGIAALVSVSLVEILGVESLGEGQATIRARMKAAPLTQEKVANELRRRMLATLVASGIKPYVS